MTPLEQGLRAGASPRLARALRQSSRERERLAQVIFQRLHPLMGWLALLFVAVLLGDNFVREESPFATIFTVTAWVIWGAFVTEYLARLVVAPSTAAFLARTWWQLIFLVLPFLGFIRIVAAIRVARAGRAVSAVVRKTRSATRALSNRLAWLSAATVIVILLATDLLYEFGDVRPYAVALHDVSLAAIGGEPIESSSGVSQILDVVLAVYAVVVFATLAGALGAFFLDREARGKPDRTDA